MPPGHAQAVGTPRRLTDREKWILRAVVGSVAVLAVAIVIAAVSSGQKSTKTCINVTAPSFIGAEQVSGCGAQARSICRSAADQGVYNQALAQTIARECRRIGLPVG